MKKTIFMILLALLLYGCGGGNPEPMEYDEEIVKKETLEYLEEKYGGNYEFGSCNSMLGVNWVNVVFKDIDRSNENGTTLIIVEWYEDGHMTDYKSFIGQGILYDKEKVKKETLNYLENKYNREYKFVISRSPVNSNYVIVIFEDVKDSNKQRIRVTWYEDGTMTDEYER